MWLRVVRRRGGPGLGNELCTQRASLDTAPVQFVADPVTTAAHR